MDRSILIFAFAGFQLMTCSAGTGNFCTSSYTQIRRHCFKAHEEASADSWRSSHLKCVKEGGTLADFQDPGYLTYLIEFAQRDQAKTVRDTWFVGPVGLHKANCATLELKNGNPTFKLTSCDDYRGEIAPICHKISCPSGALEFEDRCYVYEGREGMTWEEAEDFCQLIGGHLTSVLSEAENEFVFNIFSGEYNTWLGGLVTEEDGTFSWSDGSASAYANWGPNQPNDGLGAGVAMSFEDGTWFDYSAEAGMSTICKI